MTVYILLLVFVTAFGLAFCEFKPSRHRDAIFITTVFFVLFLLSALRAPQVGYDFDNYINYFTKMADQPIHFLFSADNLYLKEPGYGLLNWLLSRISPNPYLFSGVIALVILIPRMLFIWKYSSKVWISLFVFVSYGFFGYSICTYRQEIAISVLLYAMIMLQKRKLIPYMLLVLLATTFHFSSIVMIPIYWLAQIPLNKISLSIYAAGVLFFLLFSQPIITFVTTYVYKSYSIDNYYMRGRSVNTAFIPFLTFLCALFLMKRLLKRNPANLVFLNLLCYSTLLFVITLKHFIFQRLALIFLPIVLLLLPEILSATQPDMEDYAELTNFQNLHPNQKKQLSSKCSALKKQLDDERSIYYMALFFTLTGGWIYNLFLLSANRLGLVPYLFYFQV